VKTSRDPAPGYSLIPPKSITDPNLLRRYVADGNVVDPGDDVVRFIVGYLATHEGEPDVGAVVFEPLVKKPELATGLVLSAAADITEKDPIFDASQTRDLMRELHARAIKKDPKLWRSRLAMALWEGEQRGAIAAIEPVR